LGWGRFVKGQIDAYEIPVSVRDHRALMQEPAVRMLAEKIEEYLSRQSGSASEADDQAHRLVASGQPFEANVVQ
jgi:hypothetical protein